MWLLKPRKQVRCLYVQHVVLFFYCLVRWKQWNVSALYFECYSAARIKDDVTFISLKYYFDRALTKHLWYMHPVDLQQMSVFTTAAQNHLSSSVVVFIKVLDINDNVPRLARDYQPYICEGTQAGEVCILWCTDFYDLLSTFFNVVSKRSYTFLCTLYTFLNIKVLTKNHLIHNLFLRNERHIGDTGNSPTNV